MARISLFAFLMGFALMCYLSINPHHYSSSVTSYDTSKSSSPMNVHVNGTVITVFPGKGHRKLQDDCCGCRFRSCVFCCKDNINGTHV